MADGIPRSPYDELDGLIYFPRLCDKVRLMDAGELREDYHDNLGHGMDQWICQFLRVDYDELADKIRAGASNKEALLWAFEHGRGDRPRDCEFDWINSYIRNRGFGDDFAERLAFRKDEAGFPERDDIRTFCQFIDADEGRL